jgi:1,4-dihydroxy-6-naphthoate synthase
LDRKYEYQVQSKIDELIKKSIEFAFSNYPNLTPVVTSNAQEMSEEVMRKHIDLYVNQYSLGLGEVGKDAIKMMLQFFNEDLFDNPNLPLFV